MSIAEFRNLGPEMRLRLIGHLIMAQHARLRRGDDMTGPVGLFQDGRHWSTETETFTSNILIPDDPRPTAVQAYHLRATPEQVLDGHPFLHIPVNDNNYFHLYEVEVFSAFGDQKAGDMITATTGSGYVITVPLTQEMIDDSSFVLIRYALSK